MEQTREKIVSSYFYYMWNSWNKFECDTVFRSMSKHFWSKWCQFTEGTARGAAERFYAELSQQNRALIVNRACQIYDASHKRQIYRCSYCGSDQVKMPGWINPNSGTYTIESSTNPQKGICDWCGTHTHLVTHEQFMKETVENWWENGIDGEDREVITGLCDNDYSPDNDSQIYLDACNAHWSAKTDQQKIEIWQTINRRSD